MDEIAMVENSAESTKTEIKEFWERETCGTRYGSAEDRRAYFDEIEQARYRLEPFIKDFADFPSAQGKRVLEVGVGAGTDFSNWCKYAEHATGVDLTDAAVELTKERLSLAGVSSDRHEVMQADGENLPFEDNQFDIVYTYGVLICTPDIDKAFRECCRVLKPGGTLKTMFYRVPSVTGFLLWVRYALLKGKPMMSASDASFRNLESPGTRAMKDDKCSSILSRSGFEKIETRRKLCGGDTLEIDLSSKFRNPAYRLIQALYPSWFVRRVLGDRLGFYLLVTAKKPHRIQ